MLYNIIQPRVWCQRQLNAIGLHALLFFVSRLYGSTVAETALAQYSTIFWHNLAELPKSVGLYLRITREKLAGCVHKIFTASALQPQSIEI